ncbi:MAG: hypothetical protein EBT03_10860 [Betaproteobacteria bacterium]|nr:hypothetical protein [Betaproteobacteria bacterium]
MADIRLNVTSPEANTLILALREFDRRLEEEQKTMGAADELWQETYDRRRHVMRLLQRISEGGAKQSF